VDNVPVLLTRWLAQDILDEFSDISDSCLSNISVLIRSSVLSEQSDQQLVYEAYSNVCFVSLMHISSLLLMVLRMPRSMSNHD
jgi:hypothetical protein